MKITEFDHIQRGTSLRREHTWFDVVAVTPRSETIAVAACGDLDVAARLVDAIRDAGSRSWVLGYIDRTASNSTIIYERDPAGVSDVDHRSPPTSTTSRLR